MHSIWLSLILPGFAMFMWRAPVVRRPAIWFGIAMVFGAFVVSLTGFYVWNHLAPDVSIVKGLKLVVYRLMTMTEVPLIQLTLGGLMNLWLCRRLKPVTVTMQQDGESRIERFFQTDS